jgi:hypothetical protein
MITTKTLFDTMVHPDGVQTRQFSQCGGIHILAI